MTISLPQSIYQCYIYYCCAVPGLVRNRFAEFGASITFDPTSRMYTLIIDISWEEPTYPNGIIQSYQVAVAETISGFPVYSNDAVTDLAVNVSVMVLPYTQYTVSVAASTLAGQGDETTIIILSPEACNLIYM